MSSVIELSLLLAKLTIKGLLCVSVGLCVAGFMLSVSCGRTLYVCMSMWRGVTIQRTVAGLGLSQSRIEFSACLEVSFSGSLESFSQIVPMTV